MGIGSHPSLPHPEDESRRCTTSKRCQLSYAPRILQSRYEQLVFRVLESPGQNRAPTQPAVRNHSGIVVVFRRDPLTQLLGTCSPSSQALSGTLSRAGLRRSLLRERGEARIRIPAFPCLHGRSKARRLARFRRTTP